MDFQKLTNFIDSVEMLDFPYMDVAVRLGHKEVYRHSMGYADPETKSPLKKDSLQWLYSATKVVTCTALMRLVESGKIDLFDKASKFLPEFSEMYIKNQDGEVAKAKNDMLIWHLFSMRSGLSYDLNSYSIEKQKLSENISTRDMVKAIANEPLLFEPGTNYNYSFSHDVLAAIAEVVSGKSYYEFLKDELFIPLEINLNDIGFHPNDEQMKRFTKQYGYDVENFKRTPFVQSCPYCLTDEYYSGGAGLFATNDAYMKIMDALANGGVAENGYKVLSMESIDNMRTNRQPKEKLNYPAGYGYGLGVRTMIDKVDGKSLSPLGEFGWDGAASSYTLIDPKNKLAIVETAHMSNTNIVWKAVHPKLRNLVYEALEIGEDYE